MFRGARAVIFDLDGTLVDSIADIAHHLNDALAERGLPTHDLPSVATWVGEGARHLVECAAPAPLVDEVLAAFRARYTAHPVIHTQVYAGIDAALDAIAPSRALCVLSNKPHALTVQVCKTLLGRWPFVVFEGERSGRPPKPDPAGAYEILRGLAITPSDAVMVGDSEIDVATAKNAGMPSIAVSWGLRPVSLLQDADALVETPSQLAALFQ